MSWTKVDRLLHSELHHADPVRVKVFVQVGDKGEMIHLSTAHGGSYPELLTTLRGTFVECARAVTHLISGR